MLLPIDCPFILIKTINTIITYFEQRNPTFLIPTYQGKRGHPPIFHKNFKKNILNLPKNKGLNNLIAQHQAQTFEMEDPGIIQTFNTKKELDNLLKIYKNNS